MIDKHSHIYMPICTGLIVAGKPMKDYDGRKSTISSGQGKVGSMGRSSILAGHSKAHGHYTVRPDAKRISYVENCIKQEQKRCDSSKENNR